MDTDIDVNINIQNQLPMAGMRFYAFGLGCLTLMLVLAVPAWSINIVKIKFLFDITQDFKEPSDVAVSKIGHVYVVDGVNNRIKVFDKNGNSLFAFGQKGTRDGQLMYPLGIDLDPAGNIYIADSGNNRLQIFDKTGQFLSKIDLPDKNGKPADPTDVAVDAIKKRAYVVDNDNHRILAYDLLNLKMIQIMGQPGDQEGMFRYPFLMTLDNRKNLNIVDVINTRVQVISPEGTFIRYIGAWGVEKGRFFRPKGVAVDSNDRVYVSDSYMGVIQVFDRLGNFYGVLGDTRQSTLKKFVTPTGLFIDRANRLYVVEMLAQKVSVYQIETQGK